MLGDRRKPNDEWDFMLDKDKKIGFIRITTFSQNTTDELKKALGQLKDEGAKGLILDLRDDPGGLLSAAVAIADMFLDKGEIVSTKGRNTDARRYDAQKDGPYEDLPMAVLINQNSASASEIVAAALQDHKRAVIVGQRSYGKGSVQNIIDLDGGNSVLKLTVASYYRPSGENIHRFKNAKTTDKWGVSPDPGRKSSSPPASSSVGSGRGEIATRKHPPRAIASRRRPAPKPTRRRRQQLARPSKKPNRRRNIRRRQATKSQRPTQAPARNQRAGSLHGSSISSSTRRSKSSAARSPRRKGA